MLAHAQLNLQQIRQYALFHTASCPKDTSIKSDFRGGFHGLPILVESPAVHIEFRSIINISISINNGTTQLTYLVVVPNFMSSSGTSWFACFSTLIKVPE